MQNLNNVCAKPDVCKYVWFNKNGSLGKNLGSLGAKGGI